MALWGIDTQVRMQIAAVDAAVRDWRDLAPDEVDQEVNAFGRGSGFRWVSQSEDESRAS